jgi:hypothetical protein
MKPTACAVAGVVLVGGCTSLLPYRPRDAAEPGEDGSIVVVLDAAIEAPPARDAAAAEADVAPPTGIGDHSGPALHWRFDEEQGATMAVDSSGHGFDGVYVGDIGLPSPVADVPRQVAFADPWSRQFTLESHQAVRLAPVPPALRPVNDLTVCAWYRATTVDVNPTTAMASGSEVVSGGNHYVLRVRPRQVEFSKRVSGVPAFAQCLPTVTGHLDGNWHHLAGVSSAAGVKLYLDGTERCTNVTPSAQQPILYDQGPDLWVGRHGNNQTYWNFGGNIDDVRIYTRALAPEEIAALAAGGER